MQSQHHLQGYEHKERLEHSTQKQIFKESDFRDRQREREREWFIKKSHGPMSTVVMNIVRQLQINVKLQTYRYNTCPDKIVISIAYSKSIL